MDTTEHVLDTDECLSDSKNSKSFQSVNSRSSKRGNPSPCPICGVIISNSYNLSCHLRRHKNDKPFKCDQCPAAFILVTELKRHKVTHSKNRPFKCNICQKAFKCVESLRVHLDTHGLNEYKCRTCDLKFKDYRSRGSHEINFHGNNKLKCKYCYKYFSELKYKETHENLVHNKRIDSDLNKPKESKLRKPRKSNRSNEKKSRRLDSNFKFYACKFCSERFNFRKDQISHYQLYHKDEYDKVFKICKLCGKVLTQKHFADHMQAHEGVLPYTCNKCDYKSARKNDLANHILVHSKEYNYTCSHCEKPFRNKAASLLCEKRHTGKKDVKCNSCERTFYSGMDLRCHILSKHKRRECFLCGFETLDRYLYDRHRLLHHKNATKERSIMCEKCGLLFTSHGSLLTHLKNHLEDNNKNLNVYKICLYCDYQGTSNSDILSHSVIAHPSKVYNCEFCPYKTLKTQHFKNHLKNHNDSTEELYVCAAINKKLEKEQTAVILECFICGFSSFNMETMNDHTATHIKSFKKFTWYRTDRHFNNLLSNSLRKRKSRLLTTHTKMEVSTSIVSIKNISKPVAIFNKISSDSSLYNSDSNDDMEYAAISNDAHTTISMDSDLLKRDVKEEITIMDDPSFLDTSETSCLTPIFDEEQADIKIKIDSQDEEPKVNSEKVTIKIRKFKRKNVDDTNQNSELKLLSTKLEDKSSELNINLNVLKNKVQTINGKLFLSLEDLYSLGDVKSKNPLRK